MRPAVLGVLLMLAAPHVAAGTAQQWTASTAPEFGLGTLSGTAVDEQGRVRLAPRLKTLWGPDTGIVWDLAPSPAGGVFVALSSPGRLMHIDARAEARAWFEGGEESLVAAVIADAAGGAYFGLSPEGTLLHARAQGDIVELAQTEAKFIWALAATPDGSIWVGTGLPSRLLRYTPDGELLTVFDAQDDQVRCITALESGGVLIGTAGRGRVIRVGADGRPFVLLDADEAEIVALELAQGGVIYALAARGTKQVSAPAAAQKGPASETVRVTASAPGAESKTTAKGASSGQAAAAPTAPQRFKTSAGAALYRLTGDGGLRRIWESTRAVPFTLARGAEGKILVATGDEGRVYEIDERGRSSVLVSMASDQASAMGSVGEGPLYIGGTTDARVVQLGPGLRRAGSYLSLPIDAMAVADWGRLAWEADRPRGSKLDVFVRLGNTSTPDDTWTDWVAIDARRQSGAAADLPATRWAQVRIDMQPSANGESPLLRRVEAFYRTRNRRPEISTVVVQHPGVVWTLTPVQSSRRKGPVVADDPVARQAADALGGNGVTQPIRKSYELGARTINWKVSDPDSDRLRFDLEIRREATQTWIPLSRGQKASFLSFDTRGMPDGFYRVRLRAEDALDNPGGKQLDDVQTSSAFQIDNTRPRLQALEIRRSVDRFEIEFVASDPGGNVAAVEIAVDGGRWQPLDPLDGVADSPEERYQTVVDSEGRQPGDARMLRVRVTDAAGNLGGDAWELDE